MVNTTRQREFWDGHPIELGDDWRLHKRDPEARCQLWSHEFGFDLRLMIGDLMLAGVPIIG